MTESLLLTECKVLESFQKGISRIETWDNGIKAIKINPGSEIHLEDSQIQYQYLLSKYDGVHKHLVLVEPFENTTISKEAREFSAVPEHNKMTKAIAVVVNSLAQRLIANFIIKYIRQQPVQMKMFDNREKAIQWLLSFKD